MKNPLRPLMRGLAVVGALLLVTLVAAPAFAAPTLNVSQLTGLTDGQTVTVSGSGFEPNLPSIAIGQCIEGYSGPSDCNTAGGATFRNADANGNVASFTITVKEVFGGHDCTQITCMIAAAPLPNATDEATIAANTVELAISFGAPEPAPSQTPTTEPAPTGSGQEGLPQTGAGDSIPAILLAATAMLAIGAGVVLLVPGRQKGHHA
ncbi:neocarzinostatin apoprotein domain-containing protein [Nocardioides caricicola]|uniref:Neocarzinostatin apoprotein domain-containing protein n=1 Tax=Nocardioides caricicola TaxID=634770 RepID=A0ABW0MYL3_9ACTN